MGEAFGINVAELIQNFAKDPDGTAAKSYKSKKTAADVAALFKELVARYPGLVDVRGIGIDGGDANDRDLHVPKCRVVTKPTTAAQH